MLPIINVYRQVKVPNSEATRQESIGTFRYNTQGIHKALAKLFTCFGSDGKISPAKAWFQLEDETGTYVFDVYDADYIDVTKTAAEHSRTRRRLAADIAKEKREEDEAFLAGVNGDLIPLIRNREGNIPEHIRREYENGKKLAADIAGEGN